MRTKLIEEQLKNSDIFKTAIYNEDTKSYFIPKNTAIKPEKYHSYIIELNPILLKDRGDVITQFNWNKGAIPKNRYYKADIENIVGKMLLCTCIAYDLENKKDLNIYWSGYLPKDKIKFLEEL